MRKPWALVLTGKLECLSVSRLNSEGVGITLGNKTDKDSRIAYSYSSDGILLRKVVQDYLPTIYGSENLYHFDFITSNLKVLFTSQTFKANQRRIVVDLNWRFESGVIDYDFIGRLTEFPEVMTTMAKPLAFLLNDRIFRAFDYEYRMKQKSSGPSYHEQLQMPEWFAKREEVLTLANWQCGRCGAGDNLQVHHKMYRKRNGVRLLAWEYENDELECLCDGCHQKVHESPVKRIKIYYI